MPATWGTIVRHQKDMKLFPAAVPLEFAAVDLLGPFPKASHGNQFVLASTDRFFDAHTQHHSSDENRCHGG